MPARPPVASVLSVALGFTIAGDLAALNKFYLRYTGTAPTATQLNTFATTTITAWTTYLQQYAGTNVQLTSVTVEDLTSNTSATGTAVAAVTGTNPAPLLGPATCAVIRQQIARRYRGGHPRIYGPYGVAASLQANGTWQATFITNINSAYLSFINSVTGAVWTGGGTISAVNVSFFQGFTNVTSSSGRARPRATLRGTPIVDPITAFVLNPKPGSQRRRNKQSA